ncbi:MAG: hypothetical protein JWM28_2084, partial [Chitinophagaceae bacterium]|nr:hypothetical protein [Chitinophagaceae bacterium]
MFESWGKRDMDTNDDFCLTQPYTNGTMKRAAK